MDSHIDSQKSLFIFHRDFRIEDNNAFRKCYEESNEIVCIFIFTPEQTIDNPYFSPLSFEFLKESLCDLNDSLIQNLKIPLYLFQGTNIEVLNNIYKVYPFHSIYFNQDYTLYSQMRDNEIKQWNSNVSVFSIEDYLLKPIGTFLKKDKTPYKVYTPFMKEVKKANIEKPFFLFFSKKYKKNKKIDSISISLKNGFNEALNSLQIPKINKKTYNKKTHKGGRKNALEILNNISVFTKYQENRNLLSYSTTHLSAYIKYGCVSIREVYYYIKDHLGIENTLIQQIIWREFYYYLGYYFPYVLEGKSLKEKYNLIPWENNKKKIHAWCTGTTGFPVVDACMRELNETGFMHNRGRLITSAVLIKILDVDWRIGEKYFAQHLIDYDPMVNNGNWQWASGSGADSQPYFRIFNPWNQAILYDPDCLYIKKWVKELKDVSIDDIHHWDTCLTNLKNYPKPIVDYKKERIHTLKKYKLYLYK